MQSVFKEKMVSTMLENKIKKIKKQAIDFKFIDKAQNCIKVK